MVKLLIVGLLLVVTTAIVGTFSLRNQSRVDELEKSIDRGKITWYVEMVKAKGETEVLLRSSIVSYAVPRSLEEALLYYHVVIAEPLDSKSYAGTYDIRTWYKFRIVEELSAPTTECTNCPAMAAAPADMLPVQADEFLASQVGGEARVDGIKVTSQDPDFPSFEKGKRYLLFLSLDSQKSVGALRMGPWGTFRVTSTEVLEAVDKRLKHPLRQQIAEQFGDSPVRLKMRLRGQSKF